jgi:hypothetical protein
MIHYIYFDQLAMEQLQNFERELCNKNPNHSPCPNIKPYCDKLHVCKDLKESQHLVGVYTACMYGKHCDHETCCHFHFKI